MQRWKYHEVHKPLRAQTNGARAGRGANPPNGGNLPNGNPGAGNPGNGQNEEDQGGYNENPKRLGGYHVHTLHTSKREKKLVQRFVSMVNSAVPRYLKYSEVPITWSREDHPPNIEHPGLLALVVAPQVAGYSLNKVLMDGGSAINILYYETFLHMNLKRSQLQPTNTIFHGIVPGKSHHPEGKITLKVPYGED